MTRQQNNSIDLALTRAWQAGDRDAGAALVTKYTPLLTAGEEGQDADREDQRQERTLIFLEAARNYDPGKNPLFVGYITRILKWRSIDHLRRRLFREAHETLTMDKTPEESHTDRYPVETTDALRAAARTARLTEKQTRVFLLWMRGANQQEITAATGIQKRSVNRIKQAVTAHMKTHEAEIRAMLEN